MTQTPSPRLAARRALLAFGCAFAVQLAAVPAALAAPSAQQLTAQGQAALDALYGKSPKAAELGRRAKGVLVFPSITKAGLIVGGQGGNGVLFVNGKPSSFHRIGAASIGYQAGAQKFGYALFFITDAALRQLHTSSGWAIGTGPSLVVIDAGMAKSLNTTTLKKDVYAMSFDQRGLMAGAGLEGTKITEFRPAS